MPSAPAPSASGARGGSFGAQNDMPELADVAEEFDRMVEVLDASARDIRRAAEDNAHAFKTPIAVIRQSLEPLKRAVAADNQRGLRAIGLIESSLDRLDGLVASARHLDETTADLMDMPRSDIDLSSAAGAPAAGAGAMSSPRAASSSRAISGPGVMVLRQ